MAIDLDVHGNTKPLEAAVQAAVNRIRRTPIKITIDDKGATQPLGNMKRGADEFTKSMEAANARILAFGASMAIINGVADAFKGMVRNMVEVEKAMADINVVMGLSTQNLDKFGDGLFKVAKEAGAAFNVAAQAATEYARQGLSVEESLKRTKDALILTRLTGMDSAEAVKALTAAMNTYGSQIKDTTQLVSKFAAVDVKFAVSAEDFAQAISRAGQSALSAGVDIDEFVGIVTAAQQKTARGGAVIGNSLKTIFTRIGRTDTLNQLESLGIAVRDIEGNVLGAKTILSDLANTFDTLSAAQKAQIAQTVGGVFQINILKAVLSDAAKQNGILAEASRISAAATDESIQKNEQLRNTMSAMATETGLAIKQVSAQIGEIMLAPGMEKILNTVKSFAEGIGGALGDGESAGGKFATGLLKGIGNVLTGPGLVMLTAVFFKLLGQAAKFTKESLTSLVGTTSEAQKQKAIQTSLVTLFGQNAALNKEMLRTDISRTEKEKIILGLLKAQVAEANALNVVSKQAASTLYRQGFGPNLTQGRRKAAGHIPNYADPERAQAARGGYAAGTIRSMSMPGEGPVIYNSAETVKNFAGFKQPAIMPPQSSKAGKNYQQAFGSIHGFDPYAAGGYIPNYAKTTVSKTSDIPRNLNSKKLGDLNKDSSLILLTADSSGDSESKFFIGKDPKGGTKILNSAGLASKRTTGYYQVDVPYYSLDKNDKDKKSKSDLPAIQEAITRAAANKALDIAKGIVGGEKNLKPYNKKQIEQTFNKGAFKGAAGSTFESAIAASLKSHLFKDYKARTDTSAIDLPYDPRVFSYFGAPAGAGKMGAEVKADLANNLQQGAAKKFYQVLAGGRAAWEYKDKDYKDKTGGRAAYAGLERRGSGYFKKAYGHIPNFADPLSDAIGREKAAGVPVSQIRVGSHGALMNKSNPLGLGVTNTHDEPNGLRDVFGANGFVPNYAVFQSSDFSLKNQEKANKLAQEANRHLEKRIESYKQGNRTMAQLEQSTKKIAQNYNLGSEAQKNVNSRLNNSIGMMDRLNSARKRATSSLMRGRAGRVMSGMNSGYGMAAVGMMSGYVDDPRASQAMIGASTGGMIGQAAMVPMLASGILAPLAPFAPAIGSAIGAIVGWTNAVDDSQEALKKAGAEKAQSILAAPITSQAFKNIGMEEMGRLANLEKELKSKFDIKYKEKTQEIEAKFNDPALQSYASMVPGGSAGLSFGKQESFRSAEVKSKSTLDLEAATQRKDALIQALEGLDPSTSFMAKGLKDGKEKQFTTGTFLSEIRNLDLTKLEDQQALKQAFENGLTLQQALNLEKEKERKGIILQLNIQKAMIESQKAAAQAQFDIKKGYLERGNILEQELKLMGGFISEEQKARIKYVQGLNKAGEAYDLARVSAESTKKQGLINLVNTDTDLAQKLKISLYKEKLKGGKQESFEELPPEKQADLAKQVELTDELIKKEADKLEEILKQNGAKKEQIEEIQNIYSQSELNLQVAGNELDLTKQKLELDKNINVELGKRTDKMKELVDEAKAFNDLDKFNISKNQYTERIRRADYKMPINGKGIYRSKQQDIAFEKEMLEQRISLSNQERISDSRLKIASQFKKLQLDPDELTRQDLTPKKIRSRTIEMSQASIERLEEKSKNAEGEEKKVINQAIEEHKKITEGKSEVLNSIQKIIEGEQQSNDLLDEKNKALRKELELKEKIDKYMRGERLPGDDRSAIRRGMSETAKQMRDEVQYLDYELGQNIPRNLASGLATAMQETLNGAKSLDEALQGAAMNFLQMIQQAMLQKAAMQVVGAMGFSRGGNVRNYSRGGGVPAMVTDGEYVMGRDAVNKYGGSFMHSLNAGGSIPGFSNGGNAPGSALAANFGGGRGYKSGRAHQRKSMSGFFYSQSGNVGLEADRESLLGELAAEERARQAALAKKAKKRALIKQLIGTVASIGIGMAAQGVFGAGGGGELAMDSKSILARPESSFNFNPDPVGDSMLNMLGNPYGKPFYRGGPIRKYASGGHISGKSGIDQIPAMLSEGEYVIRASSARQIGKPTLDRINAGKFNEGGAVSEIQSSNENASANGGNTNNINISINLSKDSKSEETSESGSNKDPQKDMKALSDRIKKQVVAVIVEEQRPGGILQGTK